MSSSPLTLRSKAGLPSVAVVFGNSTAGGAYIPGMSDYSIMVKVNRHPLTTLLETHMLKYA